MKLKLIYIFVLLNILAIPVFADIATTTPTSTPGTVLGLQTPLIPQIIGQVKEAKAMLSTIPLKHDLVAVYKNTKNKKTGKTSSVISRYNLGSRDIALAILDPQTNKIITTVGKQSGKSMVFSDPNVDVQLAKFNGVNSKFAVSKPANGVVLALKYLITNGDAGSKKSIENGLSEAIYVPYSPALVTPDVAKYGQNYLNNLINNVTLQLKNIPSLAIPGKELTEAIPPAMIKALVYAEHTDTAQVLEGNDTQGTIDQLNILLATNEGDTYKYSVSSANARGIAQFIPSTYASLVKRRPEAGLIPNFVDGMSDHLNSIKAMYLLLDDYAGAVRVKAAEGFVASRVFDYGAASYNGGTGRVTKAILAFGNQWNEDRSGQINALQSQVNSLKSQVKKAANKKSKASLNAQLAQAKNQLSQVQSATLKNETVNYLAKIYKVIQHFNEQEA